jgi:Mg2+ and Co2+ transporter CorA
LQEIFAMKRLLVGIRKAVTPQRDLFASLMGGVAELPGMTAEAERHFRDIYDHLIRISDLIDTYRELLSSSMDVFLSTVSNRLNVVMKQLAVIATIFLALTFITGFFGQNFGWAGPRSSGRHRDGDRSCRDPDDLLQAPRLVLDTRRRAYDIGPDSAVTTSNTRATAYLPKS